MICSRGNQSDKRYDDDERFLSQQKEQDKETQEKQKKHEKATQGWQDRLYLETLRILSGKPWLTTEFRTGSVVTLHWY